VEPAGAAAELLDGQHSLAFAEGKCETNPLGRGVLGTTYCRFSKIRLFSEEASGGETNPSV